MNNINNTQTPKNPNFNNKNPNKNTSTQSAQNKIRSWMRKTHRYLGYFILGLVLIYGISGVILIFRDTNIFKNKSENVQILEKKLNSQQLQDALKIKDLKLKEELPSKITFEKGFYIPETGEATVYSYTYGKFITKLIRVHKLPSKASPLHWFGVTFGLIFLYLGISSLWMFKPNSQIFKKSMIYTAVGIIVAVILLFFI